MQRMRSCTHCSSNTTPHRYMQADRHLSSSSMSKALTAEEPTASSDVAAEGQLNVKRAADTAYADSAALPFAGA